jgi:glycine betaine transporter
MKNEQVFSISLLLVLTFVIFGILNPSQLNTITSNVHNNIVTHFGWGYLLAALAFFIFCILLAFSRYGAIPLGGNDEKPQYSYFGWFSMLFAAGIGIGLVFWGVAEPLNHYLNPPEYINAGTGEAAAFAMRYTFFHWSLQGWAIYIIMGLAIAYFSFRRGMPPLISSCFYPLLGEKIYKFPGHVIDTLAVLATIFGIAASLGFGALQINSGLNYVYGLPITNTITITIIALVTCMFIYSSVAGLDKGIQLLSKLNMLLALLLLLFMFIVGPTTFILNVFTSTLGEFANRFLEMSLGANPFIGHQWIKNWTLFYWAWWISWSPFVGVFIARISRGRTIKEFILGTLIAPTLLCFVWFSVFGGSALHLQLFDGIDVAITAVNDVPTTLFVVFSNFPLSALLSTIAVVLLVVFFVTSADSATFVLSMMTSHGNLNPPLFKRISWGLIQSTVATLLLISGGLKALEQMVITAALPFTFIMILLCYNLSIALQQEKDYLG